MWIGVMADIDGMLSVRELLLQPDDVMLLYTDGITEAANDEDELYGLDRLCEVISQNWDATAEEVKQAVVKDVTRHIGQQIVYDDLTLVVLKQQ